MTDFTRKAKSFKRNVVQAITNLPEMGYTLNEDSLLRGHSVAYEKQIYPGIICAISFQLKQYFNPPNKEFKVNLGRTQEAKGERYRPLIITLRNLMTYYYKERISPPEQFFWQFTDSDELAENLKRTEKLVIDYGIRWLEDPDTSMDWIKAE